jgi:hypothetical protein
MFDQITHPVQRAFLAAYVAKPSIVAAAQAAGCSREAHYDWKRDPEYARAFAEAVIAAGDTIEAEAVQRATEGLWEPVLYKGEPVMVDGVPLMKRKVSDRLMNTLLVGFKREKYGKLVTHTGTVTHAHSVDLSELEEEELEALERILGKARVNESASSQRDEDAGEDHTGSDPSGADPQSGPDDGPDVPDDGDSEA